MGKHLSDCEFYCFYCDANSPMLICKRCGHTARPIVLDHYFASKVRALLTPEQSHG